MVMRCLTRKILSWQKMLDKRLLSRSHSLNICFCCHLKERALIGKFWKSYPSPSELKDWGKKYWAGVKEIFILIMVLISSLQFSSQKKIEIRFTDLKGGFARDLVYLLSHGFLISKQIQTYASLPFSGFLFLPSL